MRRRTRPPCAGAHKGCADNVSRPEGPVPKGCAGIERWRCYSACRYSSIDCTSRLATDRFRQQRDPRRLCRGSLRDEGLSSLGDGVILRSAPSRLRSPHVPGTSCEVVHPPRSGHVPQAGQIPDPDHRRSRPAPVGAFGGCRRPATKRNVGFARGTHRVARVMAIITDAGANRWASISRNTSGRANLASAG